MTLKYERFSIIIRKERGDPDMRAVLILLAGALIGFFLVLFLGPRWPSLTTYPWLGALIPTLFAVVAGGLGPKVPAPVDEEHLPESLA
jgi:hypothetical protein